MAGGGDEVNEASMRDEPADMDVVVDGSQDDEVLERVTLDYEPSYQRFMAKEKTFTQQYSHLYTQRLIYMRPVMKEAAMAKWGGGGENVKVCEKVIDLEDGQRVVIIGTIFKDMPLRPSVLDEYREEAALAGTVEPVTNFTSDKDVLVLEDDSGRVMLGGDKLPIRAMCTGMVVAVVGEAKGGSFIVEDYAQAGLAPQNAPTAQAEEHHNYVLLMSGLKIGTEKDLLPLQLLVDYVGGHLGGMAEQQEVVSRIGRVIIAGDLVKPMDAAALKDKHLSQRQQQGLTQPLRELDILLCQLASAVPVDIMPGSDDPCNYSLPQQPLHRCLLPRASRYSTLRLVTNPYEATIGGRVFLGSSGQIIDDMLKYTSEEDGGPSSPLDLLEDTLRWRHMAPTAPDTLPCHPFCHSDPFIIKNTPHVYFTGNQEGFASSMVRAPDGQTCRVVVVPSFHTAQEAVLLNLKTLEATPLRFTGLMMKGDDNDKGTQ